MEKATDPYLCIKFFWFILSVNVTYYQNPHWFLHKITDFVKENMNACLLLGCRDAEYWIMMMPMINPTIDLSHVTCSPHCHGQTWPAFPRLRHSPSLPQLPTVCPAFPHHLTFTPSSAPATFPDPSSCHLPALPFWICLTVFDHSLHLSPIILPPLWSSLLLSIPELWHMHSSYYTTTKSSWKSKWRNFVNYFCGHGMKIVCWVDYSAFIFIQILDILRV